MLHRDRVPNDDGTIIHQHFLDYEPNDSLPLDDVEGLSRFPAADEPELENLPASTIKRTADGLRRMVRYILKRGAFYLWSGTRSFASRKRPSSLPSKLSRLPRTMRPRTGLLHQDRRFISHR
jgi:hypothetical protein